MLRIESEHRKGAMWLALWQVGGAMALLLIAAAVSAKACRAALAFFGSYYAMDAAIYIITGILKGDPLGSNLKLNLPHVIFSSIMLTLACRGRTSVPKVAATA